MVASYAALIATAASETPKRLDIENSSQTGQLRRDEIRSQMELAESILDNLADVWPIVKRFQEEIVQCQCAMESVI